MSERAINTEIISSKIKKLRNEAEWSQAKLAEKSGVSPAAISLIEKGERMPSLVVIRKLATALKVSEAAISGAQVDSTVQINKKAQAFFRDYGDIAELDDVEKEIIQDLIRRFKERTDDASRK